MQGCWQGRGGGGGGGGGSRRGTMNTISAMFVLFLSK